MLVNFRVVLMGRIEATSRADAEAKLRDGLSLNFPLHEALDEVLYETTPEEQIEDMRGRFK